MGLQPALLQVGVCMRVEVSSRKSRLLIYKTIIVSLVVIGTNVIANYGLARGMRQVGVVESFSPVPYLRAFLHPWVSIGVAFMIGWFLSRLALLSWADLSYVLPVTALSYVLSAAAGVLLLRERVNALHWAGIFFVTLGAILVAMTYPETNVPGEQR